MATEMQEKGHLGGNSISLIALETGDDPELQAACSAVFTQLETLYIKKLTSAGIPPDRAQPLGQFIQASIEGAIILAATKNNPDLLRTNRGSTDPLDQAGIGRIKPMPVVCFYHLTRSPAQQTCV
jgi:hypothetical protein